MKWLGMLLVCAAPLAAQTPVTYELPTDSVLVAGERIASRNLIKTETEYEGQELYYLGRTGPQTLKFQIRTYATGLMIADTLPREISIYADSTGAEQQVGFAHLRLWIRGLKVRSAAVPK